MQPVYLAFLSALIIGLAWQTLRDRREYEVFKQLTDTLKRRSIYVRWTAFCWLVFGGGALAILAGLGRLEALNHFPAEFRAGLPVTPPPEAETMSADTLIGFAVGAAIGLTALFFVWRMRIRKIRQPVIGDVEPMLPRERGEYPYTAAISVTAGITEELFFRLALPLLAFYATGSVIASFAIATILFGAMHWYQGVAGVLATTLVGALFVYLYLSTGSLVKPIVLHVLMDLMALVVRPALSSRLVSRAETGDCTAAGGQPHGS